MAWGSSPVEGSVLPLSQITNDRMADLPRKFMPAVADREVVVLGQARPAPQFPGRAVLLPLSPNLCLPDVKLIVSPRQSELSAKEKREEKNRKQREWRARNAEKRATTDIGEQSASSAFNEGNGKNICVPQIEYAGTLTNRIERERGSVGQAVPTERASGTATVSQVKTA
uniref:Uncharacterized protein n=1 Tax=Oryza punctata TaxID=4537 RepID=A0A0E0K0J8_ORYPU